MNDPRGDRIDDYECLNLLGKGAFASVYRARCRLTGASVAIKMIDKHLMRINRMSDRVKQEADIHRRLAHPAILRLYRFFEDAQCIYLVLELAEHGDIQNYLGSNGIQLSEPETANIMEQIVDGLQYLHANNILHRDMKLPNLLVTADMRVKIADFGLATQLARPDEPHHTMCGTPNYISPEVAMRTAHGQPADVWALGIMMYTLLVGRPPFDTDGVASTLRRVVQAELPLPMHVSPEARDLLDRLLQKDQTRRIRLDEVLRHPFMQRHVRTTTDNAQDSGLMTMSTTPSMSRVPPTTDCEYDLPAPRVVSAVRAESGFASNSNLNPFLSAPEMAAPMRSVLVDAEPMLFGAPAKRVGSPFAAAFDNRENIPANHQIAPMPVLDVAQLNADRLLPTRYETKKAVLSIDAEGRVLVELVRKTKSRSAAEICRISRDGSRLEIYQPDPGRSECIAEAYTYPHVPSKHWKKYTYAARFVLLVRAKTPKITYYTKWAKCQLMETLDDFEMFFYANDERFVRSTAEGVRFRNARGSWTDERDFGVRFDGPSDEQTAHYRHCWSHCVELERALRAFPCDSGGAVFPTTIGRRPVVVPQVIGGQAGDADGQRCTNLSSVRNGPNMQSFAMSMSSSTASAAHHPTPPMAKPSPFGRPNSASVGNRILIPGIGIASKSALGVLEIQYNDDTQLTVLPKEQGGGFVFRRSVADPNAVPMRYTIADELPELVRVRLEQIPMVLKHMAAYEAGTTTPAAAPCAGAVNGAQIGAHSTPLSRRIGGGNAALRFCR